MGLFDKLKRQMTTGGVDVELHVPPAITLGDEAVDVQLTVTGGDEPVQASNIYVELVLERTVEERHHHRAGDHDRHTHTRTHRHTIARVDSGPVDLAPGQVLRPQVTVPLSGLADVAQARPELGDNPLADAAELLLSAGRPHRDRYLMRAVVQLDGRRDPTDTKHVNVIGAAGQQGKFGFSFGS